VISIESVHRLADKTPIGEPIALRCARVGGRAGRRRKRSRNPAFGKPVAGGLLITTCLAWRGCGNGPTEGAVPPQSIAGAEFFSAMGGARARRADICTGARPRACLRTKR